MAVTKTCMVCKKEYVIDADPECFRAWASGAYVQDAFPTLDANERELLISGMCGGCFDDLVWEDDEEYEDEFGI